MKLNGEDKKFNMLRITKGLMLIFFSCTMLFAQAQVEICDNGIDDDGDGLVDAFDPDCPCDDVILICEPSCEFSVPGEALSFNVQWQSADLVPTYQSPLVGDINNDGIPDVIILSTDDIATNEPRRARNLKVLNGLTGATQLTINTPFIAWVGPTPIAIADIDGDGFVEIFVASVDHISNPVGDRRYLYCYNHDGTLRWKSNEQYGYFPNARFGSSIGLADFNSDGIPEVYVFNQIFNAQTGVKLVEGGNESGLAIMSTEIFGAMANPVAADLTSSAGLELACGNTVYEVTITNTAGLAGNSMNPITIKGFDDGFTSIADIDLDGELDVVVASKGGTATLYAWNPRNTPSIIASRTLPNTGGNWIGLPFIGDMDKDCTPEIGVTRSRRVYALKYDGTTTFQIKWTLVTSDVSGFTGITMFDFNQDGTSELVYRDETNLRIIDGSGATAVNIASFACISGTGAEMPVVADVDGDGQAEICVTCGDNNDINIGRVNLFGPLNQAWAPCRRVWNQYSYHNVNINNNLTVPIQQQPHQTLFSNIQCPFFDCNENRPFNNFLQQATTYTQDGCPVYLATDLELTQIINNTCDGSSVYNLDITITNVGEVNADTGVVVSFYAGNPFQPGAVLLNSTPSPVILNQILTPSSATNISVSLDILSIPKPFNLFVVLNDNGSQGGPISFPITGYPECDFSNNVLSISNVDCCPFGDLAITALEPENASICAGGSLALTVNASSSVGLNDNNIVWTLPGGGNVSGPSINVNQAGDYNLLITDDALCSLDTTINLQVVPLPTVAFAGNDAIVCAASFNLQGNTPTVGTGMWTLLEGSGNIANPSQNNSNIDNLAIGINRLSWTITNGVNCVSSDTVTITRIPPPDAADAGLNQEICGTSISLTANTPNVGTGVWSLVSGQGNIDNVNSPGININNLGAGNNVFQWTISNGNCPPATAQVTVLRYLDPSISVAGTNQEVCGTSGTLAGNNPQIGVGVWTVISGASSIQDSNSPTNPVTNLNIGNNVFQWTISNGTCPPSSSQVSINAIDPAIVADAGDDQQICSATTSLNAQTPAQGTGLWTLVSGSGTIANPTATNSGISNLGFGSNVFRWTLTNGPCISFDDVTILRDQLPSIANAGANQQLCGNTVTLNAINPTLGVGQWDLLAGSGNITDINNNQTSVTDLLTGINVFEWTVSNGVCPASTAQVTITVDENPADAIAGDDQQICDDNTSLAGNTPTVGSGLWTLISGTGNISNPNNANSNVTGLGFGTNVFRWTITNGTCVKIDEVSIIRDLLPSASIAGDEQQICGTSTLVSGNIPTTGSGQWSLVSGNGSIDNANNASTLINNLLPGQNVFAWIITNGVCPPSVSTLTIQVDKDPITADAGENVAICADQTTLNGNVPNAGTGTWTLISGSGQIANPNQANSTVSNLGIGNNVFRWTIINGVCETFDEVIITRDELPTEASAGTDQQICGTSINLTGNSPSIGTGIWTLVSGAGDINDPSNPTSNVSNLLPGINQFAWTISNGSCPASVALLTITVDENPITADAGADAIICENNYILQGNSANAGTGTWTILAGSATIDDINNPNAVVSNLGIGANTFAWTIVNGLCETTAQVTITQLEGPTIASAGEDQTICVNTTLLSANQALVGTGTWTLIAGQGIIDNPNANETSVSNLGAGINIFAWTIVSGICPPSSDEIEINVVDFINAEAGADQTSCLFETQLQAQAPANGVGTWSLISGSATFVDVNDPNTLVQNLNIGTTVLQWLVDNGACADSASINITVLALPDSADAGADQQICSDQTLLDANIPAVGVGTWSVIAGSAIFDDVNQNNTAVSGLQVGVNVLQWTISNGSCPPSTDQVIIIRDEITLIADAGADFSICADETNLAAVVPSLGTGIWSVIAGDGIINDVNIANSSVSNLSSGANIFQWSVSIGACPPVNDIVTITRDVPPSPANAGIDQVVCGSNATLNADLPTIGSGAWFIIGGSATIQDNQSNTTLVNGLLPGDNVFVWAVTNGGCDASNDTVVITREKNVSPADAGTDQQICADETVLSAATPFNGTGVWAILSGSGIIDDASNPSTAISALEIGLNIFEWTVSGSGACPPSVDQVSITRFAPPSEAVVGSPIITCQPTATLNAQSPAVGVGAWTVFSGNSTITDPENPTSVVTDLDIGNNVFEWTVTNGVCPSNGVLFNIERIENITLNVVELVEVCETFATLTGDLPNASTGQWTLVSGSGVIEDENDPNTNVSNLSIGENVLNWTVVFEDCDPVVATVTVIRYEEPSAANAGANFEACGTSAVLNAELPTTGTGTWSVIAGTAEFSDINNHQALVSNLSIGSNSLVWTVTNGVCPPSSDTISIEVDENPLTADAGADQTICIDNTTLSATLPIQGTGVWSLLSGQGDIVDVSDINTTVNNLGFGANIFIFTVSTNDCEVFDQVVITRLIPPVAFAGNDTIICSNTLQLNANLPDGAAGIWSFTAGSGNLSVADESDAIVSDLEEGLNILSWTLTLGDCPTSTALISITVSCNTPPIAENDFYITDEDVAVTGNFMDNNFDPDGTDLEADTIPVSGPTNGTIVINSDGSFTYTPNPLYNGQDTVVVNVCDNGIPLPPECVLDTLIFTINPINNPPVTINDTAITTVNNPVSGNVMNNNFDPDGTTLTLDTIPVSDARNGSVVFQPNGDFTYTPNLNFIGLDTVVVLVCDSGIPLPPQCSLDTLFIFVNDTVDVGLPPVTENDFYNTDEDVSFGGNIMSNNGNPNGNALVADTIPVSGPSNGTFNITSDGTFTYLPNDNWYGNDTIVILVCDSLIEPPLCANDTIFITVNAVNDPPVTVNDYVEGPYNQPISGNMNDNNFDIEGTTLSIDSIVSGPSNGTFTIDSAGNYTYIPNIGFAGLDTVVVLVCDSGFPLPPECSFDTLFITIATPDIEANAGPDQSICGTSALLSANEVTPPDTAFWSISSGTGTILNPDLNVTLVENLGLGENIFVWTVTSDGFTLTDSVTITVNPPATPANAGIDFTSCIDSIALVGNLPVAGVGTWSVLTGDGTILNPTSNETSADGLSEGLNQFSWTIVNGPCSSTDTLNVNYINVIVPEIPNDTSQCVGNNYILPLPVGTGYDLVWSSNNSAVVFGNPVNNAIEVSNLPSGSTVSFTLTASQGGCSASETFDVVILPINFSQCDTTQAIFIPEGFSPNQDGVHDTFFIYNLPPGSRTRLQVFNRWGVKVYESNNYLNDWDGTCNVNTNLVIAGEYLPEGTYYYILQFDFEFNPRIGYLTIWR